MIENYTSWNNVKKSKMIEFIEDPILSIEMSKDHFEDSYKKILKKINGDKNNMKLTMDFYFDIHPLRNNTLIFKDDNKKENFYELGIEINGITPIEKIKEGVQNED